MVEELERVAWLPHFIEINYIRNTNGIETKK